MKWLREAKDGDIGRGLMGTLAFLPGGNYFGMAGRLENGKWTMAFLDTKSGALLRSVDMKSRVTKGMFNTDGSNCI